MAEHEVKIEVRDETKAGPDKSTMSDGALRSYNY